MANRGSPGVRIEVIDNSGYEIVENPPLIAGVVGFSSKGEFNKILKINNTSVQDNTLGLGYNLPKYNMGMYATRAVLNNGGHVHFVRPFGEQVDKKDPYKSDLKSDAFVVAFDRGASKTDYEETVDDAYKLGNTSFDIRHFAATRYVADGMAGFGGKRKINTIQETISTNTNIDFQLTAGEEFNEEGNIHKDVRSETNMVLFSIVNSDPTSAQRAGDRYRVTTVRSGKDNQYVLVCEAVPNFNVGDTIYLPGSLFDGAHKEVGMTAEVIRILDTTVTIQVDTDEYGSMDNGLKAPFYFYCNNDDTTTGVDYISVKTAVANRAVKKFGKLSYKLGANNIPEKFVPGQILGLYNSTHQEIAVRLFQKLAIANETPKAYEITTEDNVIKYTKETPTESYVMVGDTIKFYYGSNDTNFSGTVIEVDDANSEFYCVVDVALPTETVTVSTTATVTAYADGVATLTGTDLKAGTYKKGSTTVTVVESTVEGNTVYTAQIAGVAKGDEITLTQDVPGQPASITKYELTPGIDTCNAMAEIVTLPIPTNRQAIQADALTGATYAFFSTTETTPTGEETVYSKNKIVLTYNYGTSTSKAEAKKKVESSFLLNDTLIVSFGTDGKEEVYCKGVKEQTCDIANTLQYVITLSKSIDDGNESTEAEDISGIQLKCSTTEIKKISDGDVLVDYGTTPVEYVVKYTNGLISITNLTLTTPTGEDVTTGELSEVVYNFTATTNNILAAINKAGYKINNYIGEDVTLNAANTNNKQLAVNVPAGTSTKYNVGDLVSFVEQSAATPIDNKKFGFGNVFEITYINSFQDIIILNTDENMSDYFGEHAKWKLVDLTASNAGVWTAGKDGLDFIMLGAYTVKVAAAQQEDAFLIMDSSSKYDSSAWFDFVYTDYESNNGTVQRTDKVLISEDVGASFSAQGLAKVEYEDVDFSGKARQMYVLSADGEAIARMYLYVIYHFNGKNYSMEGTVVPYVLNDTNLYIGDAADTALQGTGAKFLLNDSGILDNFITNNAFDLSQSVYNGQLDSVRTMLAFDERDPAIIKDAIWTYKPENNNDTATLSNAWNLFLDKDMTDVGMLVAAGTGISNLFMKNREMLNTSVISAMLDVCELRKDCFAIFDGVGEANIENALKKMIGAQGFGTKGRWGAMYDGRGQFFDSYYTLMNVEVVKSVQLASIITANAANGIWWFPPAGEINAVVPAEWGITEKYPRTFKFPEDTDSDIARLIEIHINPTRSNDKGMFIWGDYTMQKAASAFDQVHVAMLIAGIHKRFYHYLDKKVFQLNTTNLRSDITSDLQAQLDIITNSNPAGLYSGVVICNDSNNTPDVIDRNELYVDLRLKPTKTSRYITLRTIVESNGSSNTQTSTISV